MRAASPALMAGTTTLLSPCSRARETMGRMPFEAHDSAGEDFGEHAIATS